MAKLFLKNYQNIDHTFFDQSKILKSKFDVSNSKIASNGNFHQTLYISFYNNNKYYGIVKPESEYQQKIGELKKLGIDYYFSWNDDPNLENFRRDFREIKEANKEITNLKIFDLQSGNLNFLDK